jgi:hypothetical protein
MAWVRATPSRQARHAMARNVLFSWASRIQSENKAMTNVRHLLLGTALTGAVAIGSACGPNANSVQQPLPPQVAATDQSNAEMDLTVTQGIRQALMAHDGLSTAAKNITVVTSAREVVLQGEVQNEEEKDTVIAKAQELADGRTVTGNLRVQNLP